MALTYVIIGVWVLIASDAISEHDSATPTRAIGRSERKIYELHLNSDINMLTFVRIKKIISIDKKEKFKHRKPAYILTTSRTSNR